MLCLPGDLFDFLTHFLLPLAQAFGHRWRVTVGPSSLDHNAPQVRIACFGDATSPGALSAGMFPRHNPAKCHQLPWPWTSINPLPTNHSSHAVVSPVTNSDLEV
jgi:hypothetical protein